MLDNFKARLIRGSLKLSKWFVWNEEKQCPELKPQETNDRSPDPEPDVEVKPTKPDKRVRVTGYDVTYFVPEDMRKVRVRLLKSNGTFIAEYPLSDYLTIAPGSRVQIKIDT